MLLAIRKAKEGLERVGEGPFGAVIVKNGEVLATCNNTVVKDNDPSAHAEMNAIRQTCKKLGNFEIKGCEMYITCEPCPMCFGALYWCRIDKIYYGCTRFEAGEIGFDDQFIYDELAKDSKDRKIITVPDILAEECRELLTLWKNKKDRVDY